MVVEILRQNIVLIGATALLGVVIVGAAIDARREDDYKDAARSSADRARRATGGVVGAIVAVAAGILGGMYEAGVGLADGLELASEIVFQAPTMFAGLVTTVLATLGLEGVISLSTGTFLVVAVLVFALATAIRRGDVEVSDGFDWL